MHVRVLALTVSEFEEGDYGDLTSEQRSTNPAERE